MEFHAIIVSGTEDKLSPFSDNVSKSMLPIANDPMIFRALEWLRNAAISSVSISISHTHLNTVKLAVESSYKYRSAFKSINFIPSDVPDSAEAILTIANTVKSDLLIIPVDLVTDLTAFKVIDIYRSRPENSLLICIRYRNNFSTIDKKSFNPFVTFYDTEHSYTTKNPHDSLSILLDCRPAPTHKKSGKRTLNSKDNELKVRMAMLWKFPTVTAATTLLDAGIYAVSRKAINILSGIEESTSNSSIQSNNTSPPFSRLSTPLSGQQSPAYSSVTSINLARIPSSASVSTSVSLLPSPVKPNLSDVSHAPISVPAVAANEKFIANNVKITSTTLTSSVSTSVVKTPINLPKNSVHSDFSNVTWKNVPWSSAVRDLSRRTWKHSNVLEPVHFFILPKEISLIRANSLSAFLEANRWAIKFCSRDRLTIINSDTPDLNSISSAQVNLNIPTGGTTNTSINNVIPNTSSSTNSPSNSNASFQTTQPIKTISVGADSYVGNKLIHGERTSIKRTVIGDNVTIGKKCRIVGCIIFNNVKIKDNVQLDNCIIGFDSIINEKVRLAACNVASSATILAETIAKNETLRGMNSYGFNESDDSEYQDDDDDENSNNREAYTSEDSDDDSEVNEADLVVSEGEGIDSDDDGLFDRA